MVDAEIRFGPVDDSDRPQETPLERYPVTLVREEENAETGQVTLVFRGATEGIWEHSFHFTVDKPTAAAIKKYCNDRLKNGQPLYKQVLEEAFGQPNN
jgi:hypothetical protein